MVSYRQWNMMDEFLLMNQVKEDLCYVSDDILESLSAARSLSRVARAQNMVDYSGGRLRKHFVLPDFHNIMKGYVKPDDELISSSEQVLVMETERMSVPELLFHPLDVGMRQAGLSEATLQSVSALPVPLQVQATKQIVLTGGNVNFPNFLGRYERELTASLPDICEPKFILPDKPETFAWQGMQAYIKEVENQGQWSAVFLSKAQYEEHGHMRCNRFFEGCW